MKYFQKIRNKLFLFLPKPKFNIENFDDIKLHLGCGHDYKHGWVNIDIDYSVRADIYSNFGNIKNYFKGNTVQIISMSHSISYLNLWEARSFFSDAHKLLLKDGKLDIEFPDIVKCAKIIVSESDIDAYLEGIRGVFAFDLDQIKNKEYFIPYSFGWSGWQIKEELLKTGFKDVQILEPETHGKRAWRDTRVVATK
jgi:hypothetical protein